jgi:hypothetical protein
METFIEGLQANRSLEKLDFTRCDLSESVVLSPTDCCAFSTCPIRELSVEEKDNGLLVSLLALMFSNLQDLKWHWEDGEMSSDALWNRFLAADTSRSLWLDNWPVKKRDAMNSCIPKLVTLCELHFYELSSNDRDYL